MNSTADTRAHVETWRAAQRRKPAEDRVFCANWHPTVDDGPKRLRVLASNGFSVATLGYLIPVDEELVANSPGIQSWSKPSGQRSGRDV